MCNTIGERAVMCLLLLAIIIYFIEYHTLQTTEHKMDDTKALAQYFTMKMNTIFNIYIYCMSPR